MGNSLAFDGRSYSTQCTQVPRGASGSSAISAKLLVLAGAPPQLSLGDLSSPWQVNSCGIWPPGWKASLFSVNFKFASACAHAPPNPVASTNPSTIADKKIA